MQCNVVSGWHPYLQHDKNGQLPKKCHEEQHRRSNLLVSHRPMVKIKEETNAKDPGVQAPPEHTHKHKKKSRFGIRVKGSRNLGLTKGAGQCFILCNGMCGKVTDRARRSLSRLVTWS